MDFMLNSPVHLDLTSTWIYPHFICDLKLPYPPPFLDFQEMEVLTDFPPNFIQTDALVRLLPLIGSSSIRYLSDKCARFAVSINVSKNCSFISSIAVTMVEFKNSKIKKIIVFHFPCSTACLVGITGVLAPLLEETVFRGFLMVSLTQWLPTPLSVLLSAAVFAVAHLTPGEFPQLFVLGVALGLSYAQTRNLLTPITIHALWNSGVILLLTILQLQGYDIKELIQAS